MLSGCTILRVGATNADHGVASACARFGRFATRVMLRSNQKMQKERLLGKKEIELESLLEDAVGHVVQGAFEGESHVGCCT